MGGNPLFQMLNKNVNMNNGMQNMQPKNFLQFASMFSPSGPKSPEAIGRYLIENGLMSQEQFKQLGDVATQILSRSRN